MKFKLVRILLLMLLAVAISNCATAPDTDPVITEPVIVEPIIVEPVITEPVVIDPVIVPIRVEPIIIPGYAFRWANAQYTEYLVEAIKDSALMPAFPKDAAAFNYRIDADPIKFWGNLLVEMAYFESKWKNSAKYQESFRDQHGKRIWSRGLFQLSIESGRGYKCPFRTEDDLHDPKLNIECAVTILARWVKRDDVISKKIGRSWRGGGRYWSVLRGTSSYTSGALRQIKAINK